MRSLNVCVWDFHIVHNTVGFGQHPTFSFSVGCHVCSLAGEMGSSTVPALFPDCCDEVRSFPNPILFQILQTAPYHNHLLQGVVSRLYVWLNLTGSCENLLRSPCRNHQKQTAVIQFFILSFSSGIVFLFMMLDFLLLSAVGLFSVALEECPTGFGRFRCLDGFPSSTF